ncbi:flagellar export protein FliJ [Peptoanaerobacter stomatis]|uniref:Flagellar FliJ protein n=1 Tax=Peptoanaerobacter stomatis TaxID=796937 RepID=J6H8G5_9FIRM|nr:flagellar export protein FliJ [Peptoanaerobacter stomatis]EJU21505.1 flagellar export protein FliJ [Peptoanaerobacter stomatis]NWO24739.1 flagellar export protein FliJ [Peptostreptococcaceae bacterium oral taxon 081]
MSYKFRLQKVLDVKEKAEDNKKNEVYIVNKELLKANEQLQELKLELTQKGIEREEKNKEGISIIEIVQLNKYIDYLCSLIKNKEIEICELNKKLEIKKEEYIESRKERKSYENLKDKDYARYMIKEAKEEEKIIDEIVSFSSRKL